jgi:drug/metabolite transporter (DMT)-like permease
MQYQGEIAALIAAFFWTCSSMLWGKIHLSAFTLNACKNCIGVLLISIHVLFVSVGSGSIQVSTDASAWGWLALSGLIGIVVGDTLYFRSLQILGPRRALVLACLSPLFAVALDRLFLAHPIGLFVLLGILLTVTGVIVVVLDRKASAEAPGLLPGKTGAGVACGILGALCQASGGLFSQQGMENCGALEATLIRLLVAAVATICWIASRKKHRATITKSIKREHFKYLIPATALGTWLGILFSQIAYKYADLSIAQTLLSTCPLFAIPIMWILYRQRVNLLGFVGTVVAIFGIWLTLHFNN